MRRTTTEMFYVLRGEIEFTIGDRKEVGGPGAFAWVPRLSRTKQEWFETLLAGGVACGPINTIAEGVAFARKLGLDPVITVGTGDAAVSSVRNPIRLSRTPAGYQLPPPGLDEHGTEIRRWLAESAALDGAAGVVDVGARS